MSKQKKQVQVFFFFFALPFLFTSAMASDIDTSEVTWRLLLRDAIFSEGDKE